MKFMQKTRLDVLRHTKEMPIKLSLNISENNDINVYTLQRNRRINTVYTL